MLKLIGKPTQPLYQRVVESVIHAVQTGQLAAGDLLPTKAALASRLSASPVTIGQGYDQLKQMGIVTSRRGSGTYVTHQARDILQKRSNRRYNTIYVFIGAAALADCHLQHIFNTTDQLAGISEVMGDQAGRFVFLEKLTIEDAQSLDEEGALLIKPIHPDRQNRQAQPGLFTPAAVETVKARGLPVIGMWGDPLGLDIPHIMLEPHHSAWLACEHLIACGYRTIGYIGSMGHQIELGAKFFGFTSALFEAGMDYQVQHVRNITERPGMGYAAVLDIMNKGTLPEAFFVDNDHAAIEVMLALQNAGLRIPEDIGIIGGNGRPEGESAEPPLSSVILPRRDIGRRVGQLLLQARHSPLTSGIIQLDSKLILRRSTRQVYNESKVNS